jgi:hypothetical protein
MTIEASGRLALTPTFRSLRSVAATPFRKLAPTFRGQRRLNLGSAVLAAGLFLGFAGISQAAVDEDDATVSAVPERPAGAPMALNRYVRPSPRHRRSHAHRSSAVAPRPSASKKATEVADGDNSPPVPLAVANANAQMAATAPADNGKAIAAQAGDIGQNAADNSTNAPPASETQIVSADQLNEVDRALQENKPARAMFAIASANTVAAPGSSESFTWERTSRIGKIFIGCGMLLMVASAVRLFMA